MGIVGGAEKQFVSSPNKFNKLSISSNCLNPLDKLLVSCFSRNRILRSSQHKRRRIIFSTCKAGENAAISMPLFVPLLSPLPARRTKSIAG